MKSPLMKRKIMTEKAGKIFFTALMAFAVVLGCAGAAHGYLPPKFGGTLKVAVPARISKIDPTMAVEDHVFMVAGCIFETLLTQGAGDSLVPVLLEGLPVASDDRLTYYFKLRVGVMFHDGTPLDSADVVHSFKKLISNRRSPYSWIFKDVAGLEEFRTGSSRSVEGIKISDPHRFEITLSKENRNFLKYLTFPAASIIPTADRDYEPPIGTGPFIFVNRNARGDIILSANSNYREGRPYLDSIEFRLIRNDRERTTEFIRGEIDVIDYPPGGMDIEVENLFDPPLVSPMKRMYFLELNPAFRSLGDPVSRATVSEIIDRTAIVRNILNGHGSVETNITSKEKKPPISNSISGEVLPLWFPDHMTELSKIAEKISYDLKTKGYNVLLRETSPRGILQYPADDAPAMILRSLPVLFACRESLEEPLYNREYKTRQTAAVIRLGEPDEMEITPTRDTVIMLFSRRDAYMRQKKVHGLAPGPHGELEFENTFIRDYLSETEQLEN
ncbi:ABC transporter substrate-binding protein [bacterium]